MRPPNVTSIHVNTDPLELTPDRMRQLGYEAIDILVDRLAALNDMPVWRGATRADIETLLREPPPEGPSDASELMRGLARDVLPLSSQNDHARFFAYIPSCPTWPAVLGDLLARGTNAFNGMWRSSAGAAGIELMVIDWFKQWVGYPAEAEGLLVSGGSMANWTALACARATRIGDDVRSAVAYCTTQTHSSVAKALRVLGFRAEQLRALEPDRHQRLSLDALAAAVREDRDAGRMPFAVIASGGTTNSGAVDPLSDLADWCAAEALWLHVDAAYGGFAALTQRGQEALAGLGRADSITLDPHKWLFQPYEAGCVLVRRSGLLEETFAFQADYHQDTAYREDEENFATRGIELTRPARAVKIWLSLKTFGVAAFREAIDRAIDLAIEAEHIIQASSALDLVTPASLGIVCFRRVARDRDPAAEDELNRRLVDRLKHDGTAMVSSTQIDGRLTVRLCVLNHRSGREDVAQTLQWLENAKVE